MFFHFFVLGNVPIIENTREGGERGLWIRWLLRGVGGIGGLPRVG